MPAFTLVLPLLETSPEIQSSLRKPTMAACGYWVRWFLFTASR